jgi:hypothetical protein
MTAPTAYPLTWPAGWKRTRAENRRNPPWFGTSRGTYPGGGAMVRRRDITIADARERLQEELDKLGARDPILSTNMPLRLDGQPRSDRAAPDDPGAAVYFGLKGRPVALACDRWNTVAGNIAALAAHIGALRGMDRWGVGSVEQAFTGYAALPPPMVPNDWRAALGNPATLAEAETTYRERMKRAHPDAGGSAAEAARLNAAIAEARKVLR